jgi:holin-like protein
MRREMVMVLRRSHGIQALFLILGWLLCDRGVRALHIPLPSGILALLLLLTLLMTRYIPAALVHKGASSLLDHMVLFFVPAIMALLDHRELVGLLGLKILAVIGLGTLMVMIGTALVVDFCSYEREEHHGS